MPRHAFFLFALLAVPLIVGCDGCRPVAPKDPKAEEDEKAPKEAYSTDPAVVYPADQSETIGWVKPGHWMSAEQPIRSNKADTRGDLISRSSLTLRDINMEKTGTVQSLDSVRPVVLPKGQMRRMGFRFRVPVPNSIESKNVSLASRLIPRSGGVMDTGGQFFRIMSGSEYFFVILTKRPERFARLQVANWVGSGTDGIQSPSINYRVVIPDSNDLLPMPETMLDFTSTAVVLWDDLSEDALTPQQQAALADWVRFGGRLIINGPDASEAIANTSLADLLPLMPTSNIELSGDAAAALLEEHSVATDRTLKSQVEMVKTESSRIAIDGQIDDDAVAIENTSSLVLGRRVGRGHVIQPRFDLTDNWIEAWDSYDSFFNSVILNRPPRQYVEPSSMLSDDPDFADMGFDKRDLSLYFAGTKTRADAVVNTQFRIAARDSLLAGGENTTKENSPFDRYSRVDAITGVSAWNDNSDSIMLMRDTLTSEAGIEIPGSSLVIRSLAIYLVVLVPINYIVFRLMNRLEYAWFAVPVIAVIGAAWAARQARLDIGFARSNTELGMVEVHAGYPRAHLTRLIGVYNSLSSRYELQFRTVNGIASPLDDEADPNTSIQPVIRTSFEEGPSLSDFAVNSNRMRYVHTEEMVDLGGVVTFDGANTLTNEMGVELLDGIVVRKSDTGETEIAAIGSLSSGESKTIDFRATDRLMVASELPMQTSRLIRRLATADSIPNGSTRLVARIEGSLQGLDVSPSASQHVAQTVAIIHLDYADLPRPKPDVNLVSDFRKVNRLDQTTTNEDGDEKVTSETNTTDKE